MFFGFLRKCVRLRLAAVFLTGCAPLAIEDGSDTSGYNLSQQLGALQSQHVIHTISPEQLERYIARANPGRSDSASKDFDPYLTNRDLAERIIGTAACFELDPVYFAAMIRQESRFNRKARSRTGASGFTQLARIGAAEIGHQLGFSGGKFQGAFDWDRANVPDRSQAQPSVIDHFRGVLSACSASAGSGRQSSSLEDLDTFLRQSIHKQLHDSNSGLAARTEFALEFGAMILKIHVARSTDSELADQYDDALFHYNGDISHQHEYVQLVKGHVRDLLSLEGSTP